MSYDYRERQKELGNYECGQCPRCGAKLHRCPFCGEKLCIECGWDEQAPPVESDSVGLCSWCGGSGQLEKTNYQEEYPQKYDCHVCNGTGKEPIKSDKGGKNE